MSKTLERIKMLAAAARYRVSDHGYEELRNDAILVPDVIAALPTARVVEEYPEAWKGPSVLALEILESGRAAHVLWGTSTRNPDIAVLITAYIPDPDAWTPDYLSRKTK